MAAGFSFAEESATRSTRVEEKSKVRFGTTAGQKVEADDPFVSSIGWPDGIEKVYKRIEPSSAYYRCGWCSLSFTSPVCHIREHGEMVEGLREHTNLECHLSCFGEQSGFHATSGGLDRGRMLLQMRVIFLAETSAPESINVEDAFIEVSPNS
ncbi:hypothetical protein HPP92_024238 [Vanilla planifolia]|uniref:Uncharacterized protein n=1 Tax=Vanilla planifolia TaxID=51239 RepID=A0A835PPX7_VANPL|nr:hypothetical protein HPP92_024238 [Vanilla planifolia]